MFISYFKKYWFWGSLIAIFLLMAIIYIYNIFNYNTYWAYDGGAHINYIFTIVKDGQLPSMADNYLAWHEPLYYLLLSVFVKLFLFFKISEVAILKFLQFSSVVFGLAFLVGSGWLAWLISNKNRLVTILIFLLVAVWPELSEASRFVSNEILFQSLVVWWLVIFYRWQMYKIENWTWGKTFLLALGLVFLLWVKLTALIVVLSILLWFFLTYLYKRDNLFLGKILVLLLICILGFSPWLVYKQVNLGQAFTINNFEKNELGKRMPINFYLNFDKGIFVKPIWPAGTRSFWSMLYADNFGDYYNIFQNYNQPGHLQIPTINGRQMRADYYGNFLFINWFSLPLLCFLLVGLLLEIINFFKSKCQLKTSLLFIVFFGFVGGLIFNTYSYPFLERGTMKAIFILASIPIFLLLSILGWNSLNNKKILSLLSIYFVIWSVVCLLVDVL